MRNSSTTKKSNASQLQNACESEGGTVAKFKDESELRRKMNECDHCDKNKPYWTVLRYEQVYLKRKT